ncbi:TMF_TATA_bd domain-containing protein, partial [Haematococcus lacustris]
ELEASNRKLRSQAGDLVVERDKLQARVKLLESQLLEVQDQADRAAAAAAAQVEASEAEAQLARLDAKKEVAEARRVAELRDALTAAANEAAYREDAARRAAQRLEERIRSLEAELEGLAASAGQ